MSKTSNGIMKIIRWYGAGWTHPLWIFILLALLSIPYIHLMSGNWHDAFFAKLFNIMMLFQVIHIVLAGITGIMVLCRGRIAHALAIFAECAVDSGIPIKLQPAWLVSPGDQNPYNEKTKEIIRAFDPLHIPLNQGNVIFPSGNALKYLREYFDENAVQTSPYEEDPEDIKTISFGANGDVLNGNVYKTDVLEIIRTYRPSSEYH